MAGEPQITVDERGATVALGNFARLIRDKQRLLMTLGEAMLVSIRRTFREEGSPAGSWAPIAESTRKRNPKLYGAGHKLLVLSGRLLNSINVHTEGENSVLIGTNLVYAGVHQFGSRDRGGAVGPQARIPGRSVKVREHRYFRRQGLRSVQVKTADKNGKMALRTYRQIGPVNAREVTMRMHERFQNIPARPYLVFRPEDPERLQQVVTDYVAGIKAEAGLGGN